MTAGENQVLLNRLSLGYSVDLHDVMFVAIDLEG